MSNLYSLFTVRDTKVEKKNNTRNSEEVSAQRIALKKHRLLSHHFIESAQLLFSFIHRSKSIKHTFFVYITVYPVFIHFITPFNSLIYWTIIDTATDIITYFEGTSEFIRIIPCFLRHFVLAESTHQVSSDLKKST